MYRPLATNRGRARSLDARRLGLAAALLVATSLPAAGQDDPRSRLVVDAEWLQANLDAAGLVVLHVGGNYAEGHVPGSVPLELSLWEDLLAMRVAKDRAELFRGRGEAASRRYAKRS